MKRIFTLRRSGNRHRRPLIVALILSLLFSQIALTHRAISYPATDNDTHTPGPIAIGGYAEGAGAALLGQSLPPSHLSKAAYMSMNAEAVRLFQIGRNFRLNDISLVPSEPIENAIKNFEDFGNGKYFYRFCIDYAAINQADLCPVGNVGSPPLSNIPAEDQTKPINIRNALVQARRYYEGLLAAPDHLTMLYHGQEVPVVEVGRNGVLSTTREIANIHLIFGNEFLVDATDFRFSSGAFNADLILAEEIKQLEAALLQFQLAVNEVVYAANTPLGGPVHELWPEDNTYLINYFTAREFELFGMASKLMGVTLSEIASHYLVQGDRERAAAAYRNAFATQFTQLMMLADRATALQVDYIRNGSGEMFNNLTQIRARAQAMQNGIDPFGFRSDFAPIQRYADLVLLLEGEDGHLGLLDKAESNQHEAHEAARRFDTDASDMSTEIFELQKAIRTELIELCGSANPANVQIDAYRAECREGLYAENALAIDAARARVALAYQEAANIVEAIKEEQQRAGRVINLLNWQGRTIGAAELAIGKLVAYKTTSSLATTAEDRSYVGTELSERVYVQEEIKADLNPFSIGASVTAGIEVSWETKIGAEFSRSTVHSSEQIWDPNAAEIGEWESIKAIRTAEAEAQIEGANSASVVRNLLLTQSEKLIEIEIALLELKQLEAEHNLLYQQWHYLLTRYDEAQREVLNNNSHLVNPAYRLWRDSLTVKAAIAIDKAIQYAYLTAKAVEYELVTPYPGLAAIYKARTTQDIDEFISDLKIYRQAAAPSGAVNEYPYTISLAKDILGWTDTRLDPNGAMSATERANLRAQWFQAWLQANLRDGGLSVRFATSLEQRRTETEYLFSPNIWGNRIKATAINLVTTQEAPYGRPEVVLTHDGQTSYRDPRGQTVYYDLGTAAPVGYRLPEGLDPADATIVLQPSINGQGGQINGGLDNLSVAAAGWVLKIPYNSSGNLDFTKIQDIEIVLKTEGRALADRTQLATADAQRLQALPTMSAAPVGVSAASSIEPSAAFQQAQQQLAAALAREASVTAHPSALWTQATIAAGDVDLSGIFQSTVLITSPIPSGVQNLVFTLTETNGQLTGTTAPERTDLFSGTVQLTGSSDGTSFTLQSSKSVGEIDGRAVTQQFTITGQVESGGSTLRGAYVGTITGYVPQSLIIHGSFLATRPAEFSSVTKNSLALQSSATTLTPNATATISATLYNDRAQPEVAVQTLSVTTDRGTITPAAVTTQNGFATVTYTAGALPGPAVVTVTNGSLTGTLRINVVPAADAPTNIIVEPAYKTATLTWDPSPDPAVVGYNVYRSTAATTGFTRINSQPLAAGVYRDEADLTAGQTYYYYLIPLYADGREGAPSEIFAVTVGVVAFTIPDTYADTGQTIKIPVVLPNADGLTFCAADITVFYAGDVLTVTGIRNSALTPSLTWSVNTPDTGIAKAIVISDMGTTVHGPGAFFELEALVGGEWGKTSTIQIDADNSSIVDCDGNPTPLGVGGAGIFTVRADFMQGDIDGDGQVTAADVEELRKLVLNIVKSTHKQRLAGDLNYDQRLTSADILLLKRLLAGEPLGPPANHLVGLAAGAPAPIVVSLPFSQAVAAGEAISVPIQIDVAADIATFEVVLNYDANVAVPTAVHTSTLSADFDINFAIIVPGQMKLILVAKERQWAGLAGGSGILAQVAFVGKQAGVASPLRLALVRIADAFGRDFVQSVLQRSIVTQHGTLHILNNGPTALDESAEPLPHRAFLPLVVNN